MSQLEAVHQEKIHSTLSRRSVKGDDLAIFTDIYQPETNMVIWQRSMSEALSLAVRTFVNTSTTKQTILAVTPQDTQQKLYDIFGQTDAVTLISHDISQLVDMFCCLFDQKRVGLRLTILDHAMCPRFHVDRIPCRLVTTYQGIATQWLEHKDVVRSKLGAGNQGHADENSGLFDHQNKIQHLNTGDVALLKGELWDEHQGAGLVHRSPPLTVGESRLLLTIDFIN
ncbi:DUF1826 domain-containing protein [Shewanella sp. HL-SH4]|uniref:DUF1826 domain-containing protein n=1 Tax=Shewanella sp. HL-SH4 TaxID=3436240 RepID=UPI003EB84A1B